MNTYNIDSIEFEFDTVGIIGIVTEGEEFCWAMDIYAKSGVFEGEQVSPKFSFTLLEQSRDYDYDKSFNWKEVSAYNDQIYDWVASFYIHDSHYFIADIEIQKVDDKNFLVSIEGKVNLNWETAPSQDFRKFKIRNTIPFNGIISEIDSEKKALKITGKYLDTEGMKWLPKEKTSSGADNWLTN